MAKNEHIDRILSELLTKFPDASNLTLAKRLHDEHPALFPVIDNARTAVRYRRGNTGTRRRKNATHPRPNRKAGELAPLPESRASTWEPFVIDARRVLVLSDLHIPYQDNRAIEAALSWGEKFQPDAILVNGDLLDFFQISRFDKNPTLPKVSEELRSCGQFLDHLRQRFPVAGLYYKWGNHDERFQKYLFQAAPLLADIPEILQGWEGPAGIHRNGVTVIRDQRPVMLGKLRVLHGHEKGRGISSPVNQARGAFLRLLSSVLEGHGHRTSEHTERTADGDTISCRSTGCLCGLHPDYARVNKWDHGFATVVVQSDGNYVCRLHRIIDGKVY